VEIVGWVGLVGVEFAGFGFVRKKATERTNQQTNKRLFVLGASQSAGY
jgi:hypothetical protein